jgi:hypothetical protein
LVAVSLLVLLAPVPKDLRYALPVDAALRIVSASAVWLLWIQPGYRPKLVAVSLLGALLWSDFWIYWKLWGQNPIYNPVTANIAHQLKMIP